MTSKHPENSFPRMQGLEAADWLSPAMRILALETNDRVRALADREMDVGVSSSDFTSLLVEAAKRATDDANSRS